MPRLRDVRWVVGVLLLLGGFLTALRVVSGFDHSVPMWSVRHTVLPGQRIERADLIRRRVQVPGESVAYIGAQLPPAQERFAQHLLEVGELLPRSAVGSSEDVGTRVVEIRVDGVGAGLRRGSQAEVWVAHRGGDDAKPHYEHAKRMLGRVVVGELARGAGASSGGGEGRSVAVHVPAASVERVIDVVNSNDRITLVAVDPVTNP